MQTKITKLMKKETNLILDFSKKSMFNLVFFGGCVLGDREITFTNIQGPYGRFDHVPTRFYIIMIPYFLYLQLLQFMTM